MSWWPLVSSARPVATDCVLTAAAGSTPDAGVAPATGGTQGATSPAITRCAGSAQLVLYPQQAASRDAAQQHCRAQLGPSAYLPAQGAVLEAAQTMVQSAQVGCQHAGSWPCACAAPARLLRLVK
jgi:hypothetical protein